MIDTSALVATLRRGAAADALTAALAADPRVFLGEPTVLEGMTRLPLVFEALAGEDPRRFFSSLEEHPAVAELSLVFHHYDAPAEETVDE